MRSVILEDKVGSIDSGRQVRVQYNSLCIEGTSTYKSIGSREGRRETRAGFQGATGLKE